MGTDRAQPSSLGSERAILCACMRDPGVLAQLAGTLTGVWTSRPCAAVWAAMERMHAAGTHVDLESVAVDMARRDELDAAGGPSWLADVHDELGTLVTWRHYVAIVRDAASKRATQDVLSRLYDEAFRFDLSAAEYLERAQSEILGVSVADESEDVVDTKDALRAMVANIQKRADGQILSVPLPFHDLRTVVPWLEPGDLAIIGGRPAMGKTAFGMCLVEHASEHGNPCLVFSLEMTREQLLLRETSVRSRVNLRSLREGNLRDDDWPRLITQTRIIADWPMRVIETPALRVEEIAARTRRWCAEMRRRGRTKPPLILVDYLQLVSPSNAHGRGGNREQDVSEVSRGLKAMAKREGAAVVALSQVSRRCEERANKRPIQADLRESGAIEQDADIIIFLYRDEVYNENTDDRGIAELIVRKQRSGATGTARVRFVGEHVRFEEMCNGR